MFMHKMAKTISVKYSDIFENEYKVLFEEIFGRPNEDQQYLDAITSEDDSSEVLFPIKQRSPERSRKVDEIENDHTWSCLPDLLLEQIFVNLTLQERYNSSLVCRNWSSAFHLPNVWRTFVFDDKTLTRRSFNYYEGWEYKLDHVRVQLCLSNIGRHIKTLIMKPTAIFRNVYEFMNYITFSAEQQIQGIGSQITRLQYTFPCNMSTKNETELYGTGGELLNALKKLMGILPSLRILELEDLMLDSHEVLQLLDQMCYLHCSCMEKLKLINISKTQCALLHAGMFLSLNELVISPQNLNDSVLELLSETKLQHLHILQNSYTPEAESCSWKAWTLCKQRNPLLRVHLQVQSKKDKTLLWQDGAPTSTVLYDSPQIKAKGHDIIAVARKYRETLRVFGYMSLTRYYQPKSFHDRIDSQLIYLCNHCSNIHTLVIREKISTATILLIANMTTKLEKLYVRRNAVVLKSYCPRNEDLSSEVCNWIKLNSRSYESTETEVSLLLGYKWKMLSDREFKSLHVTLHL